MSRNQGRTKMQVSTLLPSCPFIDPSSCGDALRKIPAAAGTLAPSELAHSGVNIGSTVLGRGSARLNLKYESVRSASSPPCVVLDLFPRLLVSVPRFAAPSQHAPR